LCPETAAFNTFRSYVDVILGMINLNFLQQLLSLCDTFKIVIDQVKSNSH